MKLYTQDEFDTLNNSAKENFNAESKKLLKEYSDFLDTLEIDHSELSYNLQITLATIENFEYKLRNFIYVNYPKTDEVLINGAFYYTTETAIFFNLMVDDFNEARKEFQILRQDFFEKNFPEHINP